MDAESKVLGADRPLKEADAGGEGWVEELVDEAEDVAGEADTRRQTYDLFRQKVDAGKASATAGEDDAGRDRVKVDGALGLGDDHLEDLFAAGLDDLADLAAGIGAMALSAKAF